MKPLRVEIEAFGSFSDRQGVDFEALGTNELFLIHGPTGAGKSTILEAICFALYGVPAGADASAPHLRSQHAEPDRITRVTLWFALGDTRYRVERRPRQLRPAAGLTAGTHAGPPGSAPERAAASRLRSGGQPRA